MGLQMNARLSSTFLVAASGILVFASSVPAQMRGMRGSAPAPRGGTTFRLTGRFGRAHRRGFFNGSAYLPIPYPYSDYDYESEEIAPEPMPSSVVVVQPAAAPPAPAAASSIEPVLLEYRDGQWVRMPVGAQTPLEPAAKQPETPSSKLQPAAPRPPLPPAVLVFRDGHKEEIAKYMIKDGAIFTGADYWTTGSWTRKIAIADLDVAATRNLNAERATNFQLPSGPNEIMIRP